MTTTSAGQRLREAVRRTTQTDLGEVDPLLLLDPQALRDMLETELGGSLKRVRVAGPLDGRLVFLQRGDESWTVADLSGRAHRDRAWPTWTRGHLTIHDPASWRSQACLDEQALFRLSRPRMLLTALYHPENFPLPRFALGIADVARAARTTLLGTVDLADMQLGETLPGLMERITVEKPDIVGISATFGQHDLMTELLDAISALPDPPTTIAGGSLTARNERMLLDRYPSLLIARGGGEPTVQGLLEYWHGDLGVTQVPGLGYGGAARGGALAIGSRRTARPTSRQNTAEAWPELDLLPATFTAGGVAQLETSRGCTNYCSFCPRGHKGIWAGAGAEQLPWVLAEMRQVFDRHPEVARVLYLVDEEFIGRDADAAQRAVRIAGLVHQAGFAWESSCRVDQVVDPGRDEAWHVERVQLWRALLERGLRRMLFGVESGVDSVLTRFTKETTGDQNASAIRTLSALGVPPRFTYITFDHLMTLEELKATYAFQGRSDLLLKPQPGLSAEEVVRAVHDEDFVAQAATGRPLHTAISYLLVSMECLTGAAYTRMVQAAGLAGREHPAMGRVDARFADWRIGTASHFAQLWVDRNFALDYTLKSLEKVLDGLPRHAVRRARVTLKRSAYILLGEMIDVLEEVPLEHSGSAEEALSARMETMLQRRLVLLKEEMGQTVQEVRPTLGERHAAMLLGEYRRWQESAQWRLINAADPCGT